MSLDECLLTSQERAIAEYLRGDAGQKRRLYIVTKY